jgi:hypothetical protein
MIPLALLSVGKNFKSIQSNILKIVKIKDQEKLQKKFDKTRARPTIIQIALSTTNTSKKDFG